MNVVTYRTEHFEFRVPIDDWNKNKIPLPEGAGAKFIAPSDLTAILLKPFYYDFYYETDGCMNKLLGDNKILVYGKEWLDKEIHHFPFCKELLEFLTWLGKEYGWYVFTSWKPFYKAIQKSIAIEQNIPLCKVVTKEMFIAFRRNYNLEPSGYVWKSELLGADKIGHFWSTIEYLVGYAFYLSFNYGGIYYDNLGYRVNARSVRCVSERFFPIS